MKNVITFDHPLIQHKISLLRDKNTGTKEFRELVNEISMLMTYEVTRDLPLKEITVETPVGIAKSKIIAGRKIALVPIMRGGLVMADGVQALMPATKVGHVGICRGDEGINEYYCKFPTDIAEREAIVLDLMLATGRSGAAVISRVKSAGVKSVKFMCVLACNEGIRVINDAHPNVEIYCASIDHELNDDLYIVPGIGDGGDRIYGTK